MSYLRERSLFFWSKDGHKWSIGRGHAGLQACTRCWPIYLLIDSIPPNLDGFITYPLSAHGVCHSFSYCKVRKTSHDALITFDKFYRQFEMQPMCRENRACFEARNVQISLEGKSPCFQCGTRIFSCESPPVTLAKCSILMSPCNSVTDVTFRLFLSKGTLHRQTA